MDEKDNRVVGNWAWITLAVLVLSFVIYGLFFAPRAYGEMAPLREALAVEMLPMCNGNGFESWNKYVKTVVLPSDIKKRVIFLLRYWHGAYMTAESFENAAEIVAFVSQNVNEKNGILITYSPVNKNESGE